MKAMIFAAGLGTRLKPFTLNHPKALAVVNEKPLLQRNIEYLKSYGITQIVVNVHHFADQIVAFLTNNQNFGCDIQISDETDEVLETGGGLKKAQPYLESDTFLVINVDILTNLNLNHFIEHHKKNNALVSLAVSDRESSRKLLFDENTVLGGWKNVTTKEQIIANENAKKELAFSGIHLIQPEIFTKFKRNGKFSIMKTYMDLMQTETIIGYNHTGDLLLDVGKPESLQKAEQLFP